MHRIKQFKTNSKEVLRRLWLFLLVFTLIINTLTPGLAYAIDQSPKLDYDRVKPLVSEKLKPKTIITEKTNIKQKPTKRKIREDISLRTANSDTFINSDGTRTTKFYNHIKYYKKDKQNNYISIKNRVKANKITYYEKISSREASFLRKKQRNNHPRFKQNNHNNLIKKEKVLSFDGESGSIKTKFYNLKKGIEVEVKDKKFTIKPTNANNSKPELINSNTIIYKNAWDGVDIEYELIDESVKETIFIKNKKAKTKFAFKIKDAKLIDHPTDKNKLAIEGINPKEYSFSPLTLFLYGKGAANNNPISQKRKNNSIVIEVDKKWFNNQPKDSFPIIIDPTFSKTHSNSQMRSIKSDGYQCDGSVCYLNTGGLYHNGSQKYWRNFFYFDFSVLSGKKILNSKVDLNLKTGIGGTTSKRWVMLYPTNSVCYGCGEYNRRTSVKAGTYASFNNTNMMKYLLSKGKKKSWFAMKGEEGQGYTFKPFHNAKITVTYDTPTPISKPLEPRNKQIVTSKQVSLRAREVTDADGGKVRYYFRVATGTNAESGTIINSGWIDSPQWTIPDGILEDGMTYYWHVYTKENKQTNPNWVSNFKVNLREGQDNTQTYDDLGNITANLATGNATFDVDTHSMNALGGSIGLNLTYNTPNKSKKGLIGEYWNVASNYNFNNGAPNSTPDLIRRDSDLSFQWNSGKPDNKINKDWFYARHKGYFVAPKDGDYQFGAIIDDKIAIYVDNNKVFEKSCCSIEETYTNSQSINLKAGQIVPIRIESLEKTGNATLMLFVKGPIPTQLVPEDWLFSEPINESKQYGLRGRYYTYSNDKDIEKAIKDPSRLMLSRIDTSINMSWGPNEALAPGMAKDFMARWTGYITVPESGDYKIGAYSDDGIRIKTGTGLFGSTQTILNKWNDSCHTFWSNTIGLTANKPIPITIDWYDFRYSGKIELKIRTPDGVEQSMPTKWLTPSANALPDQWNLGMDIDGDINYERLKVSGNNVILEDSSRSTHTYTWTGSGYKPPINEDGFLSKNDDNTFTLVDVDGRTYIFDKEGNLSSLSTPSDDRRPAALKYEYAYSPSRLVKIIDGVTNSRYGTLHYKGVNEDNNCNATGEFDEAPNGMLCAFKTSDGKVTKFYYKNDQLVRLQLPGNQIVDYSYDELGRIKQIKDVLANDLVASGLRQNDDESITSKIIYDQLGRVSSVQSPSPQPNKQPIKHSIKYLNSSNIRPLYRLSYKSPLSHRMSLSKSLVGAKSDTYWINILDEYREGTVPIYSCKRADGKFLLTKSSDCLGHSNYGKIGYLFTQPTGLATRPLSRLRNNSTNHILEHPATNLDGWTTEEFLGYGYPKKLDGGSSTLHIDGASEPNGFSKKIEYDHLYRTTKITDLTDQTSTQKWDPVKDLLLSSTSPTGLKSTTLYDDDDKPYENYGPAPQEWFGNDNKPLPDKVNQVPKISTKYDEGLKGLSVSYYSGRQTTNNNQITRNFIGIPKLNRLGFKDDNTASMLKIWDSDNPITINSTDNAWGYRASGKLRFSESGEYRFLFAYNDGLRVRINDEILIDKWYNSGWETTSAKKQFEAGKFYRIAIEYFTPDNNIASHSFHIAKNRNPSNVSGIDDDWSQYAVPNYNLTTSIKTYDSQLGDNEVKTVYKNPTYGTIEKTILDPDGLNYENKATYEAPSEGFLRQTSKTLAGGGTTQYLHYDKDDIRDNPCTSETENYPQAGLPKGKIEADPDGDGPLAPRSSETIYNHTGQIVATRYNSDPWTCIDYDTRGRIISTTIPGRTENGNLIEGRTIINNYFVNNNPLITSSSDGNGTIIKEIDLLGRNLKYTDANNNQTINVFDNFGKITSRNSQLGTELFEYDQYDRLTSYKLDNSEFAKIFYDQHSRVTNIEYKDGVKLESLSRDELQRINKVVFDVSGSKLTDEIIRSVSGKVLSGIENGVNKTYNYDKADRLLSATIGDNNFTYDFSQNQNPICTTMPENNPNSHKNSNRTKLTISATDPNNNQTIIEETTYCYDYADRLIHSSDNRLSNPIYDSRGNIISLGDDNNKTTFKYDNSDRNIEISESKTVNGITTTKTIKYKRDVSGRIIKREFYKNFNLENISFYGYKSSGGGQYLIKNDANEITKKFVSLPGGVNLTIDSTSTSDNEMYSIANIHGDIMATISANNVINKYAKGPFGEKLLINPFNDNLLNNGDYNSSYNYLGLYKKISENEIDLEPIQMGVRVYIPILGRFLQVDPVEGGCLNNYVYAMDPINQKDLNGSMAITTSLVGYSLYEAAIATVIAVAGVVAAKTVIDSSTISVSAPTISWPFSQSRTKAKSKAKTKVKAKPIAKTKTRRRKCKSYKPALWKGRSVIKPKTIFAAQVNPKVAAGLTTIGISMKMGHKPGSVIKGYENLNYFNSYGWQKYSYKIDAYDFHYSINESFCQYTDVKEKRSEEGRIFGTW